MKLLALSLTLAALFNFPICMAQSQEWTLDRSHSNVTFTIDHLVISETSGKFDDYTLEVLADKDDFTDAKFSALIKSKSINTDDSKRDEHLRGADFFHVEKYPSIAFEGKKFEKQKNGRYKIYGKLTLHGISKDVVWDAKFNGIVKDPWGGTRAGLKVTTTLDRFEFGIAPNTNKELVGDEVRVSANFELVKKQ